jgi:uncharacterized SAM-binding protein YcdF (DUF218 family)
LIPLWITQTVKLLVLPPAGPLVVALAGLFVARRRPVLGQSLALAGVLALTLLAMPAVGGWLVRGVEPLAPVDLSGAHAQAIVVLGGGVRRHAAEYGGPTLAAVTLERVRYTAKLARATGLPVLVSGGRVERDDPVEADLMREVLEREFGVAVRFTETRSRNTHENAIESARILERSGISRVILVGHAFDFPRSRREFESAGIHVIPAPIDIPPALPTAIGDYLPSAKGMMESYYASYEFLANILFDVTHAFASKPAPRTGIRSLPAT